MTDQRAHPLETLTVDAPGATITYDVRGDLALATPECPALVLVGSPMSAQGFTTLAAHFTDRPVVTYDPRGVERSMPAGGATETNPEQHADDIRRVIEALDSGAVDLFASSGGAVNSLALLAAYPGLVRTLVAHEPPLAAFLPDGETALAVNRDIGETYLRSGSGPAMAKFLQLIMLEGPIPSSYLDQPAPDPAMFGMSGADDGKRDDPMLWQNNRTCLSFRPDVEALRAVPARVVVGAGEESARQLPGRAAAGLAEALGTPLTMFPSHHGGFLGGEFGQQGRPAEFAARLREVLDEPGE